MAGSPCAQRLPLAQSSASVVLVPAMDNPRSRDQHGTLQNTNQSETGTGCQKALLGESFTSLQENFKDNGPKRSARTEQWNRRMVDWYEKRHAKGSHS